MTNDYFWLQEQERLRRNSGCMLPMGGVVTIIAIILLMLTACKTVVEVPVEVPKIVHDTLKVVQKETETVYVTDSVFMRGDTVFKFRDRWREYAVHDTVVRATHDTISVPVEVVKVKEVARKRSFVEKATLGVGGLSEVVLLLVGAVWLRKKLDKLH